jgi:hypothetical protein
MNRSAETAEPARNIYLERTAVNTSLDLGTAGASDSVQHILCEHLHEKGFPTAAVIEATGSQSLFLFLHRVPTAAKGIRVCWEIGFHICICGKVNSHNIHTRIWGMEHLLQQWNVPMICLS